MKATTALSSIGNKNERSRDDDDSANDDSSLNIEQLMSQDELIDQLASSVDCCGSLCSSKDSLQSSIVIAMSPHELCRRIIKEQQREAQRAQAVRMMRINDDMPTLEEYINMTRPPDNDSTRRTRHRRSQSEHFVRGATATNRRRQRSNSISDVSEDYSWSTFQKTESTQLILIHPSERDLSGEETRSQSELFARDTRPQLQALDFFENSNRSIGWSDSELFERSTTSMLFEDITQSNLIGNECNQSVGLQRSQSALFERDAPTTHRRRRSHSVQSELFALDQTTTNRRRQSKSASVVLSSHPTRGNESVSFSDNTKSPCVKHEYQAQGRKIKRQHISERDAAAGKTKRDKESRRGSPRKESSIQKPKKGVMEPWKAENDNLAGKSGRSSSKVQSRNVKRRKSKRRRRRLDEKRKEKSRSQSKIVENSNESEFLSAEMSGTSLEADCPVADEELAFHVTPSVRKESDGLNAQTTGSSYSMPTIWNDDTGFTCTDDDFSDSDGDESDPSHASPREKKLFDLGALYSEPRCSPNRKASKDVFDEGNGFTSSEDDSSNYEDCNYMSERAQNFGIIVQFDANREGHISRIRPVMTDASRFQIQHGDGQLIEGHIFRMPTPSPVGERQVLRTKSLFRNSVKGFLFRRQKSVPK